MRDRGRGSQVTSANIASDAFMAAQLAQINAMVRASYSHFQKLDATISR